MVFRQAASDRSEYLQSAFPNQPPRRPEKNISRILANTGQISVRFFDQIAITHRGAVLRSVAAVAPRNRTENVLTSRST